MFEEVEREHTRGIDLTFLDCLEANDVVSYKGLKNKVKTDSVR